MRRSISASSTSRGKRYGGMPWRIRPPSAAVDSSTVTRQPRRRNWKAADRPAGPPPTTATWPSRCTAGVSKRQPSAIAMSPTKRSSLQIDTASSWPARLQAASQGWWQMRPAIAGKGLCRVSTSHAPRKSRARASPIHSAMSPLTGQAGWQGEGAWMCRGRAARQVPVLKTSVDPVVQVVGTTGAVRGEFIGRPRVATAHRPRASRLRRPPCSRRASVGRGRRAWLRAPPARACPRRAPGRRAGPS